jgi:F0F1-type ATP synthase delta subunit
MVLNPQEIARSLWALSKRADQQDKIKHFLDHLARLANEEKQKEILFITSRYPLTQEVIDEIKKLVDAPADVQIQSKLDENVLGSFQVSYRGLVYDGSVANALSQMKRLLES